ncbi:hypothetical protein [Marinicella sp. W31]|uniref:hypothetical protein n=1 Tax=Marinicella sp. W31 TaxID=3023713 RepID=UPI003757FCD6
MQISIEISLYPLQNDYIPPISAFIERLKSYSELKVIGNTMSTQVYGEYETALRIVNTEMQRTHQQYPKAAFVMKVLNGDLSPNE